MPFAAGLRPATTSRVALPAAVSTLTAALLEAAPVPSTVLGVHAPALYLDVAGRVLPVLASDAVPLATALRLAVPSGRVRWGVAAGDVVTVGAGRVVLPGWDVTAVRTWRPARVRRITRSRTAGGGVPGDGDGGWFADGIRAVVLGLACARGRQDDHPRTPGQGVDLLLGRGQGLTPSGDDALAGILLVAHAVGEAAPLAAAVRSRLGATTAVSAALLDAAADGYAAPDVVALVDAALAGDDDTLARTLPAVLAMGHSSGRDLVAGIAGAVHHLTDTTTGRSAA
ncbi:MAG TPA: DUF2877 domain-containing protein [Ornithinibacter sp.]|nr:DUF2877 domain-containing protein [Ornithinibacter sp.]